MAKKLFQLIVQEPELKGACEKIRAETLKVFKGSELLSGLTKEYSPKSVDGEPLPREEKKMVTDVETRMAWTLKPVIDMIDYELSRDKSNQTANSDLVVDGVVLAREVPATTLLSLEKRLRELREVYDHAPTLDLSKPWKEHEGQKNTWVFGPIEQYRTAKQTKAVVLHPGTDKHPPQVQPVVEDVTIGTWRTTYFSGAIQPGTKATWLEKIDKLIAAVKDARMKANEVSVIESKIGKVLMDFIHAK